MAGVKERHNWSLMLRPNTGGSDTEVYEKMGYYVIRNTLTTRGRSSIIMCQDCVEMT
jgi:hypothetical protein